MPSLLRTEALRRASMITITSTEIGLNLIETERTFRSTATITFSCHQPGASTFVDFKGEALLRATLNGHDVDLASWSDGRLALDGLAEENTLVVDGLMAYASDGEGLHRHVDPADGRTYLYAMSFLDAAPKWFACFDQPDLKSPYVFDILAPSDWTVVGNGPSVTIDPGHWRIVAEQALSSYYVTLVAGPYVSRYDEHDGIPLGIHTRASLADHLDTEAADILAVTKASFDYYHSVFGMRYPFGEYHQAFVPDFNAGAMENPGCVTFRDSFIFRSAVTTAERGSRARVIAHEMAHMWFGDLVTMCWWDDLWLNESFAEYMAHRCCQEATAYPSWVEFGILRKDWGSVADQAPSTHPVAGNGSADAQAALNDFDGISYAKGAAVLRQLAGYLGDDVFFGGLNDYFRRHAFGNAEFGDLMAAWARAGAQDLDQWATGWLQTSGMDTISPVAAASPGGGVESPGVRAQLRRGASPRVHALSVAGLDSQGNELFRVATKLADDDQELVLPTAVEMLVPDAGDETWAKIRFGEPGWTVVGPILPMITDPVTRVVVINSIRDGVRSAELDPAEALDYLLALVRFEPLDLIVESTLSFALNALAGVFCPPSQRAARRQRIHQAARDVLKTAEPGSDLQLAAFRRGLPSSDDPDRLRGWLAGDLPQGIDADPELTWAIVTRLSTLTGEEALISDLLERDPSAAAQVHAARARASLPHATAKEVAFAKLVQPSEAGAYELYATAGGFFAFGQDELTEPYVGRYFAEIIATAEFRRGWALGRVARDAFPLSAATAQTLALAEKTLARGDLPVALHRSLVDGTDLLRRAVRSLTRFATQM